MSSLVSKIRSLSWPERRLLCTSVALLVSCRLLLALSNLDRTRWIVTRLGRVSSPPTRVEDPERITWAVRCADAYLPGSNTCLSTAVVGEALLAAHGYHATVRLGVADPRTEFRAHAWVERAGTVVIGDLPDLDRYRPLSSWEVSP